MIELWKKSIAAGISMSHDNPKIFITAQWQRHSKPNVYYLVYRWTVAAFFFISWMLSIVDLRHLDQPALTRAKWLVYLTNWGFTICTLQAILCACILTMCLLKSRKESTVEEDSKALRLYKVFWALHTTATDIAFSITIIYWSLIYEANKMPIDAMNIIVHAINSVIMLIDVWIVSHPIRILHFYWPMLMGICYVVFNLIYYLAGGTSRDGKRYIYKILNWDNALFTIAMCFMVSMFLILLHCLSYGMYRCRTMVYEKIMKSTKEDKQKLPPATSEGYDNAAMANDLV